MMAAPHIVWGGVMELPGERQRRRVEKERTEIAPELPLSDDRRTATAAPQPEPSTEPKREPDEHAALIAEREALIARIDRLGRYAEGRVLLTRKVALVTARLLRLELGR